MCVCVCVCVIVNKPGKKHLLMSVLLEQYVSKVESKINNDIFCSVCKYYSYKSAINQDVNSQRIIKSEALRKWLDTENSLRRTKM